MTWPVAILLIVLVTQIGSLIGKALTYRSALSVDERVKAAERATEEALERARASEQAARVAEQSYTLLQQDNATWRRTQEQQIRDAYRDNVNHLAAQNSTLRDDLEKAIRRAESAEVAARMARS